MVDYEFSCNYCMEEIYYSDALGKVSFYRTHLGQRVEIFMSSFYEKSNGSLEWPRIADILIKYGQHYGDNFFRPHTIAAIENDPNLENINNFVSKMNEDGHDFKVSFEKAG